MANFTENNCMGHGVRIILHCLQNHWTCMHMCPRPRGQVMISFITRESLSVTCGRLVVFPRVVQFPPLIKLTATI